MKTKIWILLLAMVTLLSACARQTGYSDHLSADALADGLLQRRDMLRDVDNMTKNYFPMPDYVLSHSVYYAAESNNADQFGVFRVKEGCAADCKRLLEEEYLSPLLEEKGDFYRSYTAKEAEKLEDAEVRVFGNYVIYAILDVRERNDLFSAAEHALRNE